MTTKEILIEARQLLSDPSHWTKGADARNSRGESVPYMAETACKFCILGAIFRVAEMHNVAPEPVCDAISAHLGEYSIADFNDTRNHWAILQLLDTAISTL